MSGAYSLILKARHVWSECQEFTYAIDRHQCRTYRRHRTLMTGNNSQHLTKENYKGE